MISGSSLPDASTGDTAARNWCRGVRSRTPASDSLYSRDRLPCPRCTRRLPAPSDRLRRWRRQRSARVKTLPSSVTISVSARARLANAILLAQPAIEEHAHARFLDQIVEDRLGDVRLEVPLDRHGHTSCRRARRTRASSRRSLLCGRSRSSRGRPTPCRRDDARARRARRSALHARPRPPSSHRPPCRRTRQGRMRLPGYLALRVRTRRTRKQDRQNGARQSDELSISRFGSWNRIRDGLCAGGAT